MMYPIRAGIDMAANFSNGILDTKLDTMEADPLFQQFVRAIAIDAMKNPDKLHDAQDVWDHEWTDLLKRVEIE